MPQPPIRRFSFDFSRPTLLVFSGGDVLADARDGASLWLCSSGVFWPWLVGLKNPSGRDGCIALPASGPCTKHGSNIRTGSEVVMPTFARVLKDLILIGIRPP